MRECDCNVLGEMRHDLSADGSQSAHEQKGKFEKTEEAACYFECVRKHLQPSTYWGFYAKQASG